MNPFKINNPSEEIKGHDRFTVIQEKIVNHLKKQPDNTALNSNIAKAVGKQRPGNIAGTLKKLEEKNFITRPERNVSVYTGKKIK